MNGVNDQQVAVPECNMSCEELIMYTRTSNSIVAEIPWLTSFQIRTQSEMSTKNQVLLEDHIAFTSEPYQVVTTNTNISQINDCFVTIDEIIIEQAQQTAPIKKSLKRRLSIDIEKCPNNTKVYCWKCHLIITNKKQFSCLQCNRFYHEKCFKTVDLVCLDCDISMRLKKENPGSLAMILNSTMEKVLECESVSNFFNCFCTVSCKFYFSNQSHYLGKNKLPVNLFYVSLKVENEKYKCIFDFIQDFRSILHSCSINKSVYHNMQ